MKAKATDCYQNHVVIDLETMGTIPGSAIVSIGAVQFDPTVGILTDRTFYRELDWQNQKSSGFIVDPNTCAWWDKQSSDVRQALNGLDDLNDVLIEFLEWLPANVKVWGHGSIFDIALMEHCYRRFNIDIPWKFWNVRDTRTIIDLFETKRGGINNSFKGTKHNALDDAIHEANLMIKMYKSLLT